MFELLSKSIDSEWKILKLQDNLGAILTRLPKLIEAIRDSKETKKIYSKINMKIEIDRHNNFQALEKSMEWIKEVFYFIKAKSRSLYVKNEIDYFSKVFAGQEVIISGPSSIERSLMSLEFIVSKLAITNKSLIEKIADDNGQPYFKIKNGYPVHVTYPPFVQEAIKNITYKAKSESKELLKSDAATLLKHLQILSLYSSYKPVLLSDEINPKSWQENDALHSQAELGYYLSCFSIRNQKKYPYTREEILQQIETFLNLLEAELIRLRSTQDYYEKISVPNPDEVLVKNFIISTRRDNPQLSRDSVVGKIQVSIAKNELKLSKDYASSTYKEWDREADPIKDMNKKLKRPKSKNR